MRNNLKFGLIVITVISVFACKTESKKGTFQPNTKNNFFSVDENFCKEKGLPLIEFNLEYPKVLKTEPAEKGYQNYNYNAFFKWNKKEIQTEGISLGYYTPQKSDLLKENLKKQLLNQVLNGYGQMFQVSDAKIETVVFDNQKYLALRAVGTINNPKPDAEFVGKYLIQSLLIEPQGDNENGLLITFLANEDSEIKSFDDFANKGFISKVWETLKFE